MGNILLLAGTNRPGANALRIARVVQGLYEEAGIKVDLYSLHKMPLEIFDPRCYAAKPECWLPIQEMVVEARGLHIITPEYNGSFPGVLKYFIDMLKFPVSFVSKPVALIGEASGTWGAVHAVEQLQQVFSYRNAHIFPQRVFIPKVNACFDTEGRFSDAEILQRLRNQAEGFARFCEILNPELDEVTSGSASA